MPRTLNYLHCIRGDEDSWDNWDNRDNWVNGDNWDNWDNGDNWVNGDNWDNWVNGDNWDNWDTLGKQDMKESCFYRAAGWKNCGIVCRFRYPGQPLSENCPEDLGRKKIQNGVHQ